LKRFTRDFHPRDADNRHLLGRWQADQATLENVSIVLWQAAL
jgi:hypothetical protein